MIELRWGYQKQHINTKAMQVPYNTASFFDVINTHSDSLMDKVLYYLKLKNQEVLSSS